MNRCLHPLRIRYLLDVALLPSVRNLLGKTTILSDSFEREIAEGFKDLLALAGAFEQEIDEGLKELLALMKALGWTGFSCGQIARPRGYWHRGELGDARYAVDFACDCLAHEVVALRPWYEAVRQFQGLWRPTLMVYDGWQRPDWQLELRRVIIAGDSYFVVDWHDLARHGIFRFNPHTVPPRIDTIPILGNHPGEVIQGIYERDSETLQVCFAPPGLPRPTEFSAPSGSERWLTTDVLVA